MSADPSAPTAEMLAQALKRLVDHHVGVVRLHIKGDATLMQREIAWGDVMAAIDRLAALARSEPPTPGTAQWCAKCGEGVVPGLCRRKDTREPAPLARCPWCGLLGPDFDESPRPSDICHHDSAFSQPT